MGNIQEYFKKIYNSIRRKISLINLDRVYQEDKVMIKGTVLQHRYGPVEMVYKENKL